MRGIVAIFGLAALIGCGDVAEEQTSVFLETEAQGVLSSSLVDGTPDAVGILAWLNDESTSIDTLDFDAGLDKRAARFIIHHRNGPDMVFGTWDDNSFDTIEEVDAIKWVGPKTMLRLLGFAQEMGWVPGNEDVLGVYDRVAFTVDDSDAVLNFVNAASFEELDAILNVRAVKSIVEGRPFSSVKRLSEARYVGSSALVTLKGSATPKQASAIQGTF
jgi:hypothetical protein